LPKVGADLESINKFNEAVRFWENELASEIAVICAKLHFTMTEVKNLTIQERRMYLDKIQEMFGKKDQQPQQPSPQRSDEERFPLSPADKRMIEQRNAKLQAPSRK
jgi:hypothetical protein